MLVKITALRPREGTAGAVVYEVLRACLQSKASRGQCLGAVDLAERAWHSAQGRNTVGRRPSGWLKLFDAEFV